MPDKPPNKHRLPKNRGGHLGVRFDSNMFAKYLDYFWKPLPPHLKHDGRDTTLVNIIVTGVVPAVATCINQGLCAYTKAPSYVPCRGLLVSIEPLFREIPVCTMKPYGTLMMPP